MTSTLDINVLGIPNGSYMTVLDQADGTRIQRESIIYTNGAMSAILPIDGGITVKGYVDDSLNPSSNGAYLEGVTVGEVIFTPLSLFQNGEDGAWYDPSDLTTLFQDAAGTIPVTLDGQPVGLVTDKSGNGNNASQPVAAARPTYNETPDRLTLDKVDDSIVVNVPVGGWIGSMVIGTNEGTASYGVTIPSGDYTIGSNHFAGSSINGVLIRDGVVSASDLAKVEQAFVDDGAKASYGDVTDFGNYWREKTELTNFPLIDTSSGANFSLTWYSCSGLTSFPLINASSGTTFSYSWYGCSNLTSFPLIDTSSGTNFNTTWYGCSNLTSFPLIDTSSGTNFNQTWRGCSDLTSFPLIDTSSGTNFSYSWLGCSGLTSFPLIDALSGTNFSYSWLGCSSLTSFPAIFYNCLATNFIGAFTNTNLSQASIDGILVSINSNNTINGAFGQSGGTAPSSTGEAAISAMRSRGWTITVTGGF